MCIRDRSLPEVVATKQEGVDTSKEGLNLNKAELMQITPLTLFPKRLSFTSLSFLF